ncbi:MAG: ester cyclase [Ignavibacteriae bacterium]|nr:ester cyclase [Ignavibacteriota bacterium]
MRRSLLGPALCVITLVTLLPPSPATLRAQNPPKKAPQAAMQKNKAVVKRYFEDLWNAKNSATIPQISDPSLVFHFPGGPAAQPPDLATWFNSATEAFPDLRFTIHDLFADGDHVIARWTYAATNTGKFIGRPPTGRKVSDEGISIFRVKDGKIVEMWISQDSLGLLQQLGWVPTPASLPPGGKK